MLHNEYLLAADKVEIRGYMLSYNQLKIADLHNIPIGNVSAYLFWWRKVCGSFWKLATLLKIRVIAKKDRSCIRVQSISMTKTICWIQYTKKILEVERNGGKDGKALCKLMNNAVYEKAMGNLKKGVDAKIINNGKGYLKWASKPS